ncbi:acylneuraminate cytidylyltransferase family protein [uncultured Bacteroides sp.]|uniref:acylneuraminate cytidylyltransferase family protein n=1 Tax=uncultured Bacteroides sp. TaxID=162156 RepID=UPI0025E040EE|nr:acylneuraminate cytidylyltransferase family protein [uncultured Bacteroides sp.]
MNILVTICARGGSKGIPGKNIKLLNGKPLIGYTIDIAKRFAADMDNAVVALSTDSDEIIRIASDYGLQSDYKRPGYLANDTCGKIDVIKDILLYSEERKGCLFDYVLDLDVTSPLRTLEDLKEAFKQIQADENAVDIFSVSEPGRNPYFNQVERKANGYYAQVKNLADNVLSRQTAPKVYDLNASFYFYKRRFFDLGYNCAITDRSLIYLVDHICFDLDHPIDFEVISFLLENNKLDFSL